MTSSPTCDATIRASTPCGCRFAVDVTLRSAVDIFQGRLLIVILTGMSRDGTAGCQLVRSHFAQVFAQHADGCVVYSPRPASSLSERFWIGWRLAIHSEFLADVGSVAALRGRG